MLIDFTDQVVPKFRGNLRGTKNWVHVIVLIISQCLESNTAVALALEILSRGLLSDHELFSQFAPEPAVIKALHNQLTYGSKT